MFLKHNTASRQEPFLLRVTATFYPKGYKPYHIDDFVDKFELDYDFLAPNDFVADEAAGFSENVIGFELEVISENHNNCVQIDVDNVGILDVVEEHKGQLICKAKEELARIGSNTECCKITFLGLFSAKITPLADDYSVKYELCQLLSIKDACSILGQKGI